MYICGGPLFFIKKEVVMQNKLDFYFINDEYISFLSKTEIESRGFSRVPIFQYGEHRKQKFMIGIILKINNFNYFAPISSSCVQYKNNILIKSNGAVVSSIRFNYMFSVPKSEIQKAIFSNVSNSSYKNLLINELNYCREKEVEIFKLAFSTYKAVLLGKNLGLVNNSCDFKLLEQKCLEYIVLNKQS